MYYALVHYLENYPNEIDVFRRKYDPRIDVTLPHITFVFPVDSSIGENELVGHISTVLEKVEAFEIVLGGIEKSWDDYVFLTLLEGNERVVSLHDQLYMGLLQPHLNKQIKYIPHVTIGQVDEGKNDDAIQEAKDLQIGRVVSIEKLTLIRCQDDNTPHEWEREFYLPIHTRE